ncbi:MAG: RNA polymerase sigma-70 factor [Duncaniella sp.]|nr:RNA polymerase sigma-70 factor [Duncaniella sp.]
MVTLSIKTYTAEIFRLYYRPLCLYALHYLHDPDSAEDVVQDCMTDFLERHSEGERPANVKSYLFAMVRNRSLDYLRSESRLDRTGTSDEFDRIIDEDEYEEASFTEARLWTAIDSLPSRCREILLMCKRDGMKYEEIASELGISINTVRNQMSKALKILKEGCHRVYMFLFG